MSILIKGMEMPQEKKTTLTIFPDGRVYENHGERLWGHGKDCVPWKAVPVPPHGALKDADALIQFAKDKARQIADEEANPPRSIAVSGLSIEDVMNAPAIIPAEEGE